MDDKNNKVIENWFLPKILPLTWKWNHHILLKTFKKQDISCLPIKSVYCEQCKETLKHKHRDRFTLLKLWESLNLNLCSKPRSDPLHEELLEIKPLFHIFIAKDHAVLKGLNNGYNPILNTDLKTITFIWIYMDTHFMKNNFGWFMRIIKIQ